MKKERPQGKNVYGENAPGEKKAPTARDKAVNKDKVQPEQKKNKEAA